MTAKIMDTTMAAITAAEPEDLATLLGLQADVGVEVVEEDDDEGDADEENIDEVEAEAELEPGVEKEVTVTTGVFVAVTVVKCIASGGKETLNN